MLLELEHILKNNEGHKLNESDFQAAASLMLQKQFIWSDGHGQKKYFDLAIRFQEYFDVLFDAIGFDFVRDYKFGYCGLLPRSGVPAMTKLDTLVLLLLAKMHDEQCRKACTENGRSTPCLGLMLDLYVQMTGQEKPSRSDLLLSLKRLSRHGIISVGEIDEQLRLPQVTVLPTITKIVTAEFLANIEIYSGEESTNDKVTAEGFEEDEDPEGMSLQSPTEENDG